MDIIKEWGWFAIQKIRHEFHGFLRTKNTEDFSHPPNSTSGRDKHRS